MSSVDLLTSDNTSLSEVSEAERIAASCTRWTLSVEDLVRESVSSSTRRAYRNDLAHFVAWGGSVPSSAETVAEYLAAHATILAVATLVRRLASISKAHARAGLPSPTGSELVRATLRGIKRQRGVAQDQAAPLLRDDLFLVLDRMGHSLKDQRDRALLLLGFAGGFRRSELVGLNIDDLTTVRQGIIVTLRRSKTDQHGEGRKIGIPLGRTKHCPVVAMETWLRRAGLTEGAVFRSTAGKDVVSSQQLSGEAVSVIVKARVKAAGFDPTSFSGHSLRAGFVTSAAQAGFSSWKIRAQTGHASDVMLTRYIRDANLFLGNAAGSLL